MAGSCAGEATALGGASGWYAPSMNIHRAPFTGRNGEYYSEDGFLSGAIGSLEVPACTAVMSAFNRIGATWTGGVSKLAQAENLAKWTFDQNDPAEYRYAREARHALLYPTANSHVMNGAMHGSVWVDGPQKLEVVRWVATGVSVVGLGPIGFTAWRNHVKRRAERAELE